LWIKKALNRLSVDSLIVLPLLTVKEQKIKFFLKGSEENGGI
jgi:hypothetical protein